MGKTIISVRLRLFCGPHPHVCGEHTDEAGQDVTSLGSSPRMRGTQPRRSVRCLAGGLIPTYAGNTVQKHPGRKPRRAHPHVCGEHGVPRLIMPPSRGSSPRMRGTHSPDRQQSQVHGLIPTYAGNTRALICSCRFTWAHPHVCGEHAFFFDIRGGR